MEGTPCLTLGVPFSRSRLSAALRPGRRWGKARPGRRKYTVVPHEAGRSPAKMRDLDTITTSVEPYFDCRITSPRLPHCTQPRAAEAVSRSRIARCAGLRGRQALFDIGSTLFEVPALRFAPAGTTEKKKPAGTTVGEGSAGTTHPLRHPGRAGGEIRGLDNKTVNAKSRCHRRNRADQGASGHP